MSDDNVDKKAKTMGHVSKEEWKGDPDKWRPAEEFVERGENIMPILKDRLSKVEGELKMALKMNKTEMQQIKDDAYKKATAEYDAKIKKLEKKEQQAFDDGDAEKFQEVKQERSDLAAPEKPTEVAEAAPDPVFEDWSKKNAWYTDDPLLRRNAEMIGGDIQKATPGLGAKEFYDKVEAQIREEFPHKFTNQAREDAASVEGGGDAPSKRKNSFEDLPSNAKAAFKKLADKAKAQGREYTKAAYTAAYYE